VFWLWWVVIEIGLLVASYYLAPRPPESQPGGLSDFSITTADGSRAIPVVWGTVKTAGNCVWYGALTTEGYTMEGSKGENVGYYYYLAFDIALCHGPVDEILDVRWEDKSAGWVVYAYHTDFTTYLIQDGLRMFGGERGGGGVYGLVDFYPGAANQAPNPCMLQLCSADYPGMGHICHAVFHRGVVAPNFVGFYVGNGTYIKPISFIIVRCPNTLGLTGNKHIIVPPAGGKDANPACALYEILTDLVWGVGLPSAAIDTASFVAAGEALYAEGLGVSMIVERQGQAGALLEEVLRHIDGVIYSDPATGLMTLKLIREDYDPGTLPVFDESNLTSVEFTRGAWTETSNVVKVTYVSREDNFTERVAQWQNLANLQVRGEVAEATHACRGLSNSKAAGFIAGRLIRASSYPLARVRAVANRSAWSLRPGSVFKLDWPALGITGMICRAGRIQYGDLTKGSITIEAVEDVFGVGETTFTDPAPSGWIDPVGSPAAAAFQTVMDEPYELTRRADRFVTGGNNRYGTSLAARSQSSLLGYELWHDIGAGYVWTTDSPMFAPTGLLKTSYAQNTAYVDDTGFIVDTGLDLDHLASVTESVYASGESLLMIDNEIMAFRDVEDLGGGEWAITHIMRGVLDTVPVAHAADARVWFLSLGGAVCVNPAATYGTDGIRHVKVLPFNTRRRLPIAEATEQHLTCAGRNETPYPPGNLKVNGVSYPTKLVVATDCVLTWNNRHRVKQGDAVRVVSQGEADFDAAIEGIHGVQIYVNSSPVRSINAGAAKTWTWTAAMQATDGAVVGASVLIWVYGAYSSWNSQAQSRLLPVEAT